MTFGRSCTHAFGSAWRGACLLLTIGVLSTAAWAGGNTCEPGEIPDVIVGDLHQVNSYGSVGDIAAFSVGTTSCNLGTCWLEWFQNSNRHPVIGQNMYRLKDGRFEQIGQSWLKHGFFALSESLCATPESPCIGTAGDHLGVSCSDPYSAGLNGQQSNLGPKFEVNAATGAFNWPFAFQGQTGNAIFKRLQVHHDDLDPTLNPDALYFVEGQYVTPDDASAGVNKNNASYRPINVFPSGGSYAIQLTDTTERTKAAIQAWKDNDTNIDEVFVGSPDGGLFIASAKATSLGDGLYHYEYAIQNLTSHRSGGSFTVGLPWGANVSNVGFHDVDYHSGEPYDGTDWEVTIDDFSITWATTPHDDDPNANALRWGTMYNFRFDTDVPPAKNEVLLGLFRPGTPDSVPFLITSPATCNFDGVCDPGEDCTACAFDCLDQSGGGGCCGDAVCDPGEDSCACLIDCGPPPSSEFFCSDGEDEDCDQQADCDDSECCFDAGCGGPDTDGDNFEACDCDDSNPNAWFRPEEVEDLISDHDAGTGETTMTWTAPLEQGGTSVTYETIRSSNPVNFVTSSSCLISGTPEQTSVTDVTTPAVGQAYYYVTRAVNECPADGEGSLGRTSDNVPREGRSCP